MFSGVNGKAENGGKAAAVFAFQTVDQVKTLFHFLQALGVELDPFQVVAQGASQLGQGFFQQDRLICHGFLGGIHLR